MLQYRYRSALASEKLVCRLSVIKLFHVSLSRPGLLYAAVPAI